MESTVDPTKLPYREGQWFTVEPNMVQATRSSLLLAHQAGMRIYTMDVVKEGDPVPTGCFWQTSTDWAGVRRDTGSNLVWLRRFVKKHDCFAILTDGANGFVGGSRDVGIRSYPPFQIDRPAVDSTRAGDLFRAGCCSDWIGAGRSSTAFVSPRRPDLSRAGPSERLHRFRAFKRSRQ